VATRWEQSGYQGHDAPPMDPPRPDITQYNNVFPRLKHFEHKLNSAISDLQSFSDRLSVWTKAQSDYVQASKSLEAATRSHSKLIALFKFRKDRSHIKTLRAHCDALVVDDRDRQILEERDSELQRLLMGFKRALAEWQETIDNPVIWQGYASWQRRRMEARASSVALQGTLQNSSEAYLLWQNNFNLWRESFKNAVTIKSEGA